MGGREGGREGGDGCGPKLITISNPLARTYLCHPRTKHGNPIISGHKKFASYYNERKERKRERERTERER